MKISFFTTSEKLSTSALTDEAALDDMLNGIAIAPNLATFANVHKEGSTESVN
ncbi:MULTISPECIES: hypothetical protein [unclassified Nostoc]|uniref:hypothetical protein n=1 Tax=unclassified Nostoc TaxID=2593658 RepID=UPI001671DC8B|nr:hypothetical protein [Nostoc sp. 'Peltigera membranacea cyanobiont' 232]